ncbi:hypothetical protein CYMTET_21744 [Cymbomonas tetramitiformis]|uniref:Uncharacterized protein n=1 Tax=Cymbomonas tetramitiformis TaxID=36881 RepID=A0AAE0G1T7_9CHLO|nr:hypothetical protein CYMTET_21744 [Cymbomonas tetramitiformis]
MRRRLAMIMPLAHGDAVRHVPMEARGFINVFSTTRLLHVQVAPAEKPRDAHIREHRQWGSLGVEVRVEVGGRRGGGGGGGGEMEVAEEVVEAVAGGEVVEEAAAAAAVVAEVAEVAEVVEEVGWGGRGGGGGGGGMVEVEVEEEVGVGGGGGGGGAEEVAVEMVGVVEAEVEAHNIDQYCQCHEILECHL